LVVHANVVGRDSVPKTVLDSEGSAPLYEHFEKPRLAVEYEMAF
jgi:hypothetical protein